MANPILAFPDYTQADPDYAAVALHGGLWEPALPLSNLLSETYGRVARTVDCALSSTQFDVDLGLPRSVLVAAIPRCNGSRSCRVRITAYAGTSRPSATATPLADTGWRDLYGIVYPQGSVVYESEGFWDGKLTAEEAASVTMPFVAVFPETTVARWWRVEVDDTTNPAGYFELPRLVLAGGWMPSINFKAGAQLGLLDLSTAERTLSGGLVFDRRPRLRAATFQFDLLEDDEALTRAHDMQMALGISGQFLFVWDYENTAHMHRRTFLARMQQLQPLEAVAYGWSGVAFSIEEVVG